MLGLTKEPLGYFDPLGFAKLGDYEGSLGERWDQALLFLLPAEKDSSDRSVAGAKGHGHDSHAMELRLRRAA